MTRFIAVLICGLSVTLARPALAQDFCSELPACPDDGATPQGDMMPACSCPRPASCDLRFFFSYFCQFLISSQQWSCECSDPQTPEERPDFTPEPFAPPGGFCGGLVCSDGSAPRPDGGSCLCPDSNAALVIAERPPRTMVRNSCFYPLRDAEPRREPRRLAGWRAIAKPNYCPVKPGLAYEAARVAAE